MNHNNGLLILKRQNSALKYLQLIMNICGFEMSVETSEWRKSLINHFLVTDYAIVSRNTDVYHGAQRKCSVFFVSLQNK